MPELPEVETVRRSLIDLVLGRTIKSVEVIYPKIIKNISTDDFINNLRNQKINDIARVGKYLLFILDDYILLSHLRMEGKYFYKNTELTKHDHIVFNLDDGYKLVYNDTRKFGIMMLFNTTSVNEVKKQEPLVRLGEEPLTEGLSKEYLYSKLKNKKEPIKSALLDQSIISGLGNIYADEVCFLSRLNPKTIASTLTLDDCAHIVTSSNQVITKAISLGGTTIKSFMSSHEISGLFQNELNVHTKETCKECGEKIIKIRVGGRGTYYCPNCQK